MVRFNLFGDVNGRSDLPALAPSDTINARALAATTAESDTIPTGAKFVLITATDVLYYRVGGTATVPGDTTDGSAAELLPLQQSRMVSLEAARTTGSVTASDTALTLTSTDGFRVGDTIVIKGAGGSGADLSTTISALDRSTGVATIAAPATTTVSLTTVTKTVSSISVISPNTCIVTLSYYK